MIPNALFLALLRGGGGPLGKSFGEQSMPMPLPFQMMGLGGRPSLLAGLPADKQKALLEAIIPDMARGK